MVGIWLVEMFSSAFLCSLLFASLSRAEMTEPASLNWEEVPAKAISLRAGEEVELKCGATGSPPPTIHWYKDGVRVAENPLAADEDSVGTEVEQVANEGIPTIQMATTYSKLRLPCLDKAKSGRYSCVAANGLSPVLSHNVSVEVAGSGRGICPSRRSGAGVAASIGMWTDMRLERSDAVAQLFCRASGEPRPQVRWFHLSDDMEKVGLVRPSQSFILLRNGDLLVRQPQPETQGGFNFLCEASNDAGTDTQAITLVDVSMDEDEDYVQE